MKTAEMCFSENLPPPPATILAAGSFRDFETENLKALGYDVTADNIREFPKARTDAHEYDVAVLKTPSKSQPLLKRSYSAVRPLLKPTGTLILLASITDGPLYERESGISKEMITALYESGFRLKSVKRIETGEENLGSSMVIARKDKVFLRPYRSGDEDHILPMFQEVFGTDRTMAHWKWKYSRNPFGNHRIALAVTEDGDIAAHFCGYGVPFYSSLEKKKEIISLQGADTMTHPRFRQMGLGTTAVLTRVATYFFNKFCVDRMPFMYGYNTGHIKKFGERFLGYRYLSPIPYHVLDVEAARPGRVLLGRFSRRLPGITVRRVRQMEPGFNRLFLRACGDYGFLVKKDADYLKWRYLDCPDGAHQFFAVRCFGRLVGWSVFKTREDVLIWGDALFEKKFAWTVGAMIQRLIHRHFPHITRIEGWFSKTPGWWRETLTKQGFRITGDPHDLAAGIIFFDETHTRACVDKTLYYTMGDSDLF